MKTAELTLDGNAIAGALSEVFAHEMTGARGACAACGTVAELGSTIAYTHAPGAVCRCRVCGNVLVVLVRRTRSYRVSLRGLSWVDVTPAE